MTDLRIGAIGCGYWGPNLIRNFVEISGARMIAISDLQQESIDRMMQRFPQIESCTQDYRDLFDMNLDAVVIATPPADHYSIARDCLEHGLHVLVEKPITLDSDDAAELVRVAKEHKRILMVGHTFEYNPAVRALKEMIREGELGDIFYIDAIRASLGLFQTKANVIWDLAPHDISIIRYLLGTDPIGVSTHATACVQDGIEDIAYMTLAFPNNVLAHIRSSWLDPSKQRRVTVVGSKKMVIYDDVEPLEKIKIYDKGVKAIRHTDTYGEFSFAYHYGDVVIPYIRFEEPLRVQCQHFLDCIREGTTPQTDGVNGMRVVQIVEAAQRSLKNGGETVWLANGTEPVSPQELVHA
jgi:predicted dehydrogenase